MPFDTPPLNRVRKISPMFSLQKVFPNPGRPDPNRGTSWPPLSKTPEKGHLHRVFVRDIPTSGSRMSQEYPAQKLYFRLFFRPDLRKGCGLTGKILSWPSDPCIWTKNRPMLGKEKCPRDPPVLKMLRRVSFGTGRKFGTDIANFKGYGEGSDMLVFTLPALQKNFVNILFEFAWEFCIENGRDFWWIFFGLRVPRNETRSPWKIRENSEPNSGQNSGRKFEKFGKLSFCNFSDLIVFVGKETGKWCWKWNLRRRQNTTDSSAVLFFVQKGPWAPVVPYPLI